MLFPSAADGRIRPVVYRAYYSSNRMFLKIPLYH